MLPSVPMPSSSDASLGRESVESLARKVLIAAGLNQKGIQCESYLSRLERAAGCHLAPLPSIVEEGGIDGGGGNGVLTCTDPNEKDKKKRPASDVWNPLDAITSSSSGSPLAASSMDICNDSNDDDSLEVMTPFTGDFYRCVGELVCECLAPGSYNIPAGAAAAASPVVVSDATSMKQYDKGNVENGSDNVNEDETRYSLPRDNDAVRATRLLCAMMEFNVHAQDSGEEECSFLSLLLRHCEGNKPHIDGPNKSTGESNEKLGEEMDTLAAVPTADQDRHHVKKTSRIPIISAAYRHLSSLPSLEAYVRSWGRRRRYPQSGRTVVIDATVTLATPEPSQHSSTAAATTTTTQLSTDAASDRLRSLKRWENEKDRLEAELNQHISMLEFFIGSIYKECDAELRGRCRTKLGGILHVFALSSGGPAPMARTLGGAGSGVVGALGGPGLMGVEDASAAGIDAALKIILRIVEGIDRRHSSQQQALAVLGPSHESLLFGVLIPLHKPSGMVLWRDQTPVLGLYHETLVRCIGALLVRNKLLIAKVIRALLHPDIWPTEGGAKGGGRGAGGAGVVANTPKVVLLLHEVDTYLGLLTVAPPKDANGGNSDEAKDQRDSLVSSFSEAILPLTVRLASCIESDNSRTSERALQYFRNAQFKTLIKCYKDTIMPVLLRALCRVDAGMQVPWNPTVRKMTLLVLTELETVDEELFERSCEDAFGARRREHITRDGIDAVKKSDATGGEAARLGSAIMGGGPTTGGITNNMTSLRGGMGSWRPPTGAGAGRGSRPHTLPRSGMPPAGNRGEQPPLSITGVAPWAVGGGATSAPRAGVHRGTKTKQPGRGMGPWATQKAPAPRALAAPPINKRKAAGLGPIPKASPDEASTEDEQVKESASITCPPLENPGLQRVRRYMEELKPPKTDGQDDSGNGVSSWAKAQMAESPTLLPSLKFHDLVFGQNLGEGSFGSVRYARQIVKDRTRSQWPEYAVKVVSTQKITELGYEQSINREISILRMLSHPGIARLISTFRFRDGAYLVLEYASGGDLHTLLKRNGSIDHASTQFVIGEIIAALSSIHDAGFVYGDLKPENCLITESGHIKLTDFGGCRPFTEQAKEMVKMSSKNVIKELRDGDWKEKTSMPTSSQKADKDESCGFEAASEDEDKDNGQSVEDEEDDFRIEGTTAYLPPEVVVGGIPTTAADSWALGCVLYQCISGRPPLLEDTDHLTKHKIVTFELSSSSHEEDFFGIHDDSTFRPEAKEVIRKLLSRNPHDRPGMHVLAHDDFFEGKNVFELHKHEAFPLDIGSVAPVADAKWNRRQFSSIWAPQPKQYAIDSLSSESGGASSTWDKEKNSPIREGLERVSPFLSTKRPTALMQIGE